MRSPPALPQRPGPLLRLFVPEIEKVAEMKKRHWLQILSNIDLFIASAALVILTIITSAGVFMRYVLRTPLLWQEEIQAFCQVWMVFMGSSVAFRLGGHVAVEIFVDMLSQKAQRLMGYFIDLIVLVVLLYLFINCRDYVEQVFGRSGRPTSILRIPYTLLYGVAPYACIMMIVSYFAGKYAPGFVKMIDIEATKDDGYTEVM